jgi:hypothetical protein
VYTLVKSHSEVREWAQGTLNVHANPPTDEEFISELNHKRLPYEPVPSMKQHFGCHLLLRPGGTHSFFTHGTHGILDARPNLRVLSMLFEAAAGGQVEPPALGTDVRNLPVDLINLLGKDKFEKAKSYGWDVPRELKTTKVSTPLSHAFYD